MNSSTLSVGISFCTSESCNRSRNVLVPENICHKVPENDTMNRFEMLVSRSEEDMTMFNKREADIYIFNVTGSTTLQLTVVCTPTSHNMYNSTLNITFNSSE